MPFVKPGESVEVDIVSPHFNPNAPVGGGVDKYSLVAFIN